MKHFKSSCVIIFNYVLLLLERCLPVSVLLLLCKPLAWFLTVVVFCFSKRKTDRDSYTVYLNKFLPVFSARLAEEKWASRCEVHISDECSRDMAAGKPMIFVFLHEGNFKLIPYWLRALGIRASAIIKTKASRRKRHRLWRDRRDLFSEQKTMWGRDELKGFIGLLSKGGTLVMAVDSDLGKLESITLKDGKEMIIASGPFRLAEKHNCVIYPCGLFSRRDWEFCLRIGDRYSGDKSKLIDDLFSCYNLG